MLPFGCNTSQPIPNILADTFFSKNGQVKFWPDNENFGSVFKNLRFVRQHKSLVALCINWCSSKELKSFEGGMMNTLE